jgi:L-amino acid N-acyltransferase YncA
MGNQLIRMVSEDDSHKICEIYNHYVENTCISFEETPVSIKEMDTRIASIVSAYPYLVYEMNGEVLGYAYANRWKERSAYRFTAEVTVYIDKDHVGKGIGHQLLEELMTRVRRSNIHVLMAVIAIPNEKSIQLHERFGFKKAGYFTGVGYKNNRWIDVGYWELIL